MSPGADGGGAALTVRGAVKSYGALRALDGVDLEVARGEHLALLGANGAGKTTLMRAIAGRISLDRGRIEILGRPAEDRRSELGLVPQEIALYASLTVRENLEVFAALHGVRGAARRERVGWALDWTALEDRDGARVGTLSGGMKRRLNIACGVLHAPALVLLDEPTAGVDHGSRLRIRAMLEALCDDGAAVLHSTHELAEAESSCHRVVILDRGRVLAAGTPEALVASTVGTARACRATIEPAAAPLELGAPFRVAGTAVTAALDDVPRQLPVLLTALAGSGAQLRDLRITAPGLADVFDRLTGRERET